MTELASDAPALARTKGQDRFLFAACFVALVATSFAFIIRVMLMETWQIEFGFSETQKGEISGAGLWPFGLSIVLFSLIIDRVGYGKSMIFAFACHMVSAILMATAQGYWSLYIGSILNGLAAGTVEAVINPAIASMYPKAKTRMLTILHAGWPGGFVLGGVAIMFLTKYGISWRVNTEIILIPTLLYGAMLLKARFPVSERVTAGVSYRDMLREAGALGCLIVVYMICMEVNRVLGETFRGLPTPWLAGTLMDTTFVDLPSVAMTVVLSVLTLGYLLYTRSLGRWMYILLLLVMILLAITELGTDGWIKDLMRPNMDKIGLDSGWLIIYTATIMMVLRFCIAPIEKLLKPLGVLFFSSAFAAAGIYFLAGAQGGLILLWATIYGVGQCFFWPVTLGLVAERFPRGGALTLNAIAGVGMLGVGIIGLQMLGFWQDTRIDKDLKVQPALHAECMESKPKKSIFGKYTGLNRTRVSQINDIVALEDYRIGKIKEQLTAKMTSEEKARFLADLELTGDLSAEQQRDLAAAKTRLSAVANRTWTTPAFAATLAQDKKYQTLVRSASDRLAPAEPAKPGKDADLEAKAKYEVDKAAHEKSKAAHAKATETFATRLAYLAANGILTDTPDSVEVRKANVKKQILDKIQADAKQNAMSSAAILPLIMAACYLGLIIYFRAKGGYKAVDLVASGQPAGGHAPTAEEVADAEDTPSE